MLPSFSLIPKNDKSLLLIGAGMAPMKKYFTGELTPPSKRVTTCQKCIRTGDIENVGKTDRHATFFEMLGNFSFGDYFKEQAISWAYEFLTEVIEIDKDILWASVYEEDQEAYDLWHEKIGLPKDRIVKLGKDDNFWELEVGPSGPCSEIYIDRGEEYGCGDPDCKPGCECDRFIEVWNLVFTQFDKDEKGVYHPLSHPNIDTGMGLERLATVLQETDNIFEIDALQEIISWICKKIDYKYGEDRKKDVSIRVITDHIRAITFLISDTVTPSNEGRGYVLRRLIRRAARHGKLLGIKDSFLSELSKVVIDSWGEDYYPELKENKENIVQVIKIEEEKFLETLESGIKILNSYIDETINENSKTLIGEKAFKLYDTYGFPVELTAEILEEKDLNLDWQSFRDHMEEQRQRARDARNEGEEIGWSNLSDDEIYESYDSEFLGYELTESAGKVLLLTKDNKEVSSIGEKEKGVVVLDKTPFYGQSGGQVGDTGFIEADGLKVKVLDTKKSHNDLIIHVVEVLEGSLKKGQEIYSKIDVERRNNIRRNHSVTHLLHKSLKEVLGDHVNQAGSEVHADYMRFDFTHFKAISQEELKKIEELVNQKISESLKVTTEIKNLQDAYKTGAIGLFEEKYGDTVRIVSMGDFSTELCGGTHVSNTSEIEMFKILSEQSVSSGVRRIESITGPAVYRYLNQLEDLKNAGARILKTDKNSVLDKISYLIEENKKLSKEIEKLKLDNTEDEFSNIINNVKEFNSVKYVTYKFEDVDLDTLRNLADRVINEVGSIIVLFATVNDDKLNFVCAVSSDLIKEGYKAGNIIKKIAKIAGGGGGGRPNMATAGGKDLSKVEEALNSIEEELK